MHEKVILVLKKLCSFWSTESFLSVTYKNIVYILQIFNIISLWCLLGIIERALIVIFINPQNNYYEQVADRRSWLRCLVFGPLYWYYKGIFLHALASLVLAVITGGISWLFYPFFTYSIIRYDYLKKGWIEIDKSMIEWFKQSPHYR